MKKEDMYSWLTRGYQRKAVLLALPTCLTAKDIWIEVKQEHPHIALSDVCELLRSLAKRRIIAIVGNKSAKVKVYRITAFGRRSVKHALRKQISAFPSNVSETKLSFVMQGRVRQLAVWYLYTKSGSSFPVRTASGIRAGLSLRYSTSLRSIQRTLKDLVRHAIVRITGVTKKRQSKLYGLTRDGKVIGELIEASKKDITFMIMAMFCLAGSVPE